MENLLAIEFMSILPYIIVAVMLIIFAVIVIIAVKKRNKPTPYVPDEVDRSVDEAARQKARDIAPEQAPEQTEVEPTVDTDEDDDEEITFEAEDVDEDDGKQDNGAKKDNAPDRKISYRILYDRETKTWEIRKDMAKRVIRRVKTKKEALEIAQELSKNQDLNLVVHKKDGKFQKKDSWSRNISTSDNDEQ